jgi:hypothetical protein
VERIIPAGNTNCLNDKVDPHVRFLSFPSPALTSCRWQHQRRMRASEACINDRGGAGAEQAHDGRPRLDPSARRPGGGLELFSSSTSSVSTATLGDRYNGTIADGRSSQEMSPARPPHSAEAHDEPPGPPLPLSVPRLLNSNVCQAHLWPPSAFGDETIFAASQHLGVAPCRK